MLPAIFAIRCRENCMWKVTVVENAGMNSVFIAPLIVCKTAVSTFKNVL